MSDQPHINKRKRKQIAKNQEQARPVSMPKPKDTQEDDQRDAQEDDQRDAQNEKLNQQLDQIINNKRRCG